MSERNPLVPAELEHLSTLIDSRIECLAESSSELRSIALCAAKHIFDWALQTEEYSKPHLGRLLATLTEATPPQTRSQAHGTSTQSRSTNTNQKNRNQIDIRETPLPALFTEGMNTDQIWQQLELRSARICENLRALQGEDENEDASSEGENSDDNGSESEDEQEEDEEGDDAVGMDIDDESPWEGLSGEEGDDSSTSEGVTNLQEETSEDEEDHSPPTSMLDVIRGEQKPRSSRPYSHGRSDLDDGFFDLATFNAETSEAEGKTTKGTLHSIADEDSTEESEVDLFGSVDSRAEVGDDGVGECQRRPSVVPPVTIAAPAELVYGDFFEPPPRNRSIRPSKVRFHKRVSIKKIKAVGKGMPVSALDEDEDEDEENN